MEKKLAIALLCYVALAIFGYFTLVPKFRFALWIFLAGLAIKTWIASVSKREM